ncbi:hypothetical protein, partial [Rhodococcus rhodochrous]
HRHGNGVDRHQPLPSAKSLFTRAAGGGRGKTSRYDMNLEFGLQEEPLPVIGSHYKTHVLSNDSVLPVTTTANSDHQVFVNGALGKSAGRIWEFLPTVESATQADVVKFTGISDKTVRTKLALLVKYGLVTREGRRNARYSISPTADLDAVAGDLGVSDYDDRVKARHAEERESYRRPMWEEPGFMRDPMPELPERATTDPFTGEAIYWAEAREPINYDDPVVFGSVPGTDFDHDPFDDKETDQVQVLTLTTSTPPEFPTFDNEPTKAQVRFSDWEPDWDDLFKTFGVPELSNQ